jgi:hypothetical protein
VETTAADERATTPARDLRDVVRTARRGVETLVATRADPFFVRELGMITTGLTAALDPLSRAASPLVAAASPHDRG